VVNNMQWTGHLSVIEFLRDVGKHFSLNTMLGRDTVKRRLEGEGISFTEFSYMLLQANDYLQLRRTMGCTLQIGGSDQWGNIIGGVDLNRRVDGESVHAMTVPLVTSSDGKKFGKSTGGGSLWLDPSMTSPYTWFQYFFNTADADVIRYLRWFSFLGREEIAELEAITLEKPHLRAAQKRLAEEMTTLVHGVSATESVEAASQALFGRGELTGLDESTLAAALEDAGAVEIAPGEPSTIVDLLAASGLCESKGAARRAVGEGGAYVNNERISDPDWAPTGSDLLHGGWLVLRRGKKSFAGVRLL
jgi:tyrosyl-tRNA synthetase